LVVANDNEATEADVELFSVPFANLLLRMRLIGSVLGIGTHRLWIQDFEDLRQQV
jgi:hypothetical protein